MGSLFILMGQPKVISPPSPLTEPIMVSALAPLTIIFNRPISQQVKAHIDPPVIGTWQLATSTYGPFLPNRLQFIPDQSLQPATEYQVSLKYILPVAWTNLNRQQEYLFVFNTPPRPADLALLSPFAPTAKPTVNLIPTPTPSPPIPTPAQFSLNIPLYKQHHTFTCYSVAAKMALGYRGVTLDEVGFLNEIGYDTTPRNYVTNTWGDPYHGVVGTYNGSGVGGYGAHWPAVAKALSQYRQVEIKENWNLPDLLETVKAGNPVMVWWVNGVWPAKDTSWNNAQGEKVYTVNGMHVEVVKGWLGPQADPTYILTNDPWRGNRQYTPQSFHNLWQWFHNSAIIVY